MEEIISRTVRIRVSGRMAKESAGMMAEIMNRMVAPDIGSPPTPFCAMQVDPDIEGGPWAVFIRNNAIRAL